MSKDDVQVTHPLTDEMIAEYWPEANAPDIRRHFDVLMAKCAAEPYRGFPRFPDLMAGIITHEARLPQERIDALAAALGDLPEHLREQEWFAGDGPVFGSHFVYGDMGWGTGRQAIADCPGGKAFNLAPFIAAASPRNVSALLATTEALRAENDALRHWAWGHIDALLLYAAGTYPNDSHVKDAVEFCRIIGPNKKLRMDPLNGSGFHPARLTLERTEHEG